LIREIKKLVVYLTKRSPNRGLNVLICHRWEALQKIVGSENNNKRQKIPPAIAFLPKLVDIPFSLSPPANRKDPWQQILEIFVNPGET
jgi:hypothetical protein